jgi:hypothetical protein
LRKIVCVILKPVDAFQKRCMSSDLGFHGLMEGVGDPQFDDMLSRLGIIVECFRYLRHGELTIYEKVVIMR